MKAELWLGWLGLLLHRLILLVNGLTLAQALVFRPKHGGCSTLQCRLEDLLPIFVQLIRTRRCFKKPGKIGRLFQGKLLEDFICYLSIIACSSISSLLTDRACFRHLILMAHLLLTFNGFDHVLHLILHVKVGL